MATGTGHNSPGREKRDPKIVIAAFAISFVMVLSIPFLFGNDNGNGCYDEQGDVLGAGGSMMVAAGYYHSLALKDDGTVWAWGRNNFGQLGDGTNTDSSTPVQVSGLTGIVAISSTNAHSLALDGNGTVWAWGFNDSGQLGDGTATDSSTPMQVPGLTDVMSVAAGGGHSMVLKNDGTVWSWGANNYGQLGDGTTTNSDTPVAATGLTDIVAISAAMNHSLALKNDGTVWAWGYNWNGELGDGGSGVSANKSTPVQVKDTPGTGHLADIAAIAAGHDHSLALKNDGTVWAWGYNVDGQLGDGTNTRSSTPVQVKDASGTSYLTDIVAIAAGNSYSVALENGGTVWSWGYNNSGRLGDNTVSNRSTPVQVHGPGNAGFLEDVASVSAGNAHSIVIKDDGTVWAWGLNTNGRLGDGTTTDSRTPVQVIEAGGDEFSLVVPETVNNSGNSRSGGGDGGGNGMLFIVIGIVAAVVIVGAVYFFVIKKK